MGRFTPGTWVIGNDEEIEFNVPVEDLGDWVSINLKEHKMLRVRLGTLKRYIHEAVSMTSTTTPSAPTDDDATVPGHLPNELPKSATIDEQGWVPGRWFPNGYEPEPYDEDRLGNRAGAKTEGDDLDETDSRMMGDHSGNGFDPNGENQQDVAEHLRDDDTTSLGDVPEERPEKSAYDEAFVPWLDREIRRFLLQEYPVGAGMVDPTKKPMGFYSDFDMDRDHEVDIHGFWYASPARTPGQDGDPMRDADPYAQMGFHPPKGADDPTATHPATTGEDGAAARRCPPIPELTGGGDTSATLGPNAKPGGSGGESQGGQGTQANNEEGSEAEGQEQG